MATLGEGEGPGGAGCASNAWMLQLVRGTEGILRMLYQCQQTSKLAIKQSSTQTLGWGAFIHRGRGCSFSRENLDECRCSTMDMVWRMVLDCL